MRTAFIANEQRKDILHTHTREQSQTLLISFFFVFAFKLSTLASKIGKMGKTVFSPAMKWERLCALHSYSVCLTRLTNVDESTSSNSPYSRRIGLWDGSDRIRWMALIFHHKISKMNDVFSSSLLWLLHIFFRWFFYRRMQSVEIMKVGNGSSRSVVECCLFIHLR